MYGHDDRREDESENAGLTRSVGVVVDERFRQTRPVYCTGCTSERVMMLPMTFVLAAIILLTYYPFVILEPHETTYQKFEMNMKRTKACKDAVKATYPSLLVRIIAA